MRFRAALPVIGILCLVPALYFVFPKKPDTTAIGDFTNWQPTAGDIRQNVGIVRGGHFGDSKHTRFAQMFQDRFRKNELAIGLKFLDDNTLKAMFAPIISRWDMARVAVQAEAEAHAIFGRPIRVDIYETYITAPMRKLGEVKRINPAGPVQVRFSPNFAIMQITARRALEARRPRPYSRPMAAPIAAGPSRVHGGFTAR